jgi:regulatory protein
MKILRVVKKDDRNIVLHFDNDEKLVLDYEVFVKSRLRKSDDISEEQLSLLISQNSIHNIKRTAFKLLSRRLHSVNELRIKLKQKKLSNDLIEIVIDELKAKDLLDDFKFAGQFSEENIRNKLWGKGKLKAELIKRGVSHEIISKVLEEKFPEREDLSNAILLSKKKLKLLSSRKLEKEKLESKILSFLYSRGYDYDTSRQAVNEVMKDSTGSSDLSADKAG